VEFDRLSLLSLFFGESFVSLVCELFRAHEVCSWLEVTEKLKCNVNHTVQLLASREHLTAPTL